MCLMSIRYLEISLHCEKKMSVSTPNSQHVINEKLTIFSNERIGCGAFGVVFRGTYKGRQCAVKVLHHTALEIQTNLPAGLENETAMKAFDHEC